MPAGYVTVTFDAGEGKTLLGRDKFYVKANIEVDLTSVAPKAVPKPDFKFKAWDSPLKRSFAADTKISATYESSPGEGTVIPGYGEKPEDYVKITFKPGEHGNIYGLADSEGNLAFYVKQGVNVDLTSVAPKVYSDDSYKFTNWDKPLKGIFNADTEVHLSESLVTLYFKL